MEEEEEDKLLLSSLGVTSANAEDIERQVLSEAKNDAEYGSGAGDFPEEEEEKTKPKEKVPSYSRRAELHNKLRALEVEIDAVASSVDKAKSVTQHEQEDRDDDTDIRDQNNDEGFNETLDGLTLQKALAAERLKSLKKARIQLQKELSNLGDDASYNGAAPEYLLEQLVKEKPNKKLKLNNAVRTSKDSKRRVKAVAFDEDAEFDSVLDSASAGFVETERDELVRKGMLTPFHRLKGFERRVEEPGPSDRQDLPEDNDIASASIAKVAQAMSEIAQARPTTQLLDAKELPGLEAPTRPFQRLKTPLKHVDSSIKKEKEKEKEKKIRKPRRKKRPLPGKKWRDSTKLGSATLPEASDEEARKNSSASDFEDDEEEVEDEDEDKEENSVNLEGGFKIPVSICNQLFDYQKVGVQWLWELHCQRAGGIIGDEMGLGKTVQVISFLGALYFSKMYKPSIVVCPITLLRQWQREARKWAPKLKVHILHDSAHARDKRASAKSDESEYDSDTSLDGETEKSSAKSTKRWDDLINRVVRSESGLLLTTYEQLRILGDKLLDIEWGYAILDEGHRIRNPNAEITLVCKQLQTVHRIIMTGAPIQNKLSELWSLFDFVFPGKLGVLPVFEAEFAVPITVGGYANATPLQVSTAYRCAVVLRDLIMPYLLRRMKADVNAHLPKKTEHVLFCSLTQEQRSVYRAFLASSEVEQIFDGSRNSLYGIDVMRKICNHPDLLEREHSSKHPDYGNPERSGKMMVISQVLKVWKEQGNRVLLFSQTQQMLDIIENFLIANEYSYRRMDGRTPANQRMALIDEFNNSDEVFIFILTTKVGGLGTNLTGANRVIIYDPDWNPSTDMQARERAWRIGQKRDVTVYRLITRGTIEEKVYHRQIYKHFLTNKILKNPQQKRFFRARDMKDLFTLQDDKDGNATETSNIFGQLTDEVHVGITNNTRDAFDAIGSVGRKASNSRGKRKRIADKTSSEVRASASSDKEEENIESVARHNREVDEETDILKSLFDAHGLHSALDHDAIINANDDDKIRLEERASQVAQRAAEALRESRMLRSRESFAVPTWTGRSGAAGAPTSVRKKFGSTVNTQLLGPSRTTEGSSRRPFGLAVGASSGKALSSSELLAKIRGTQEKAVGDARQQDLIQSSNLIQRTNSLQNVRETRSLKDTIVQPEILIRQLCSFIQQRGGSADSASITQHFKDRIQSRDLPLFKNLLKEIATLVKDADGSSWVLKQDYR